MENNQKIICGVVVKSHPKSHIAVVNEDDELFACPIPTYDDEAVVVLQVAPAGDYLFIVEFVLKDDYNGLKDQIE